MRHLIYTAALLLALAPAVLAQGQRSAEFYPLNPTHPSTYRAGNLTGDDAVTTMAAPLTKGDGIGVVTSSSAWKTWGHTSIRVHVSGDVAATTVDLETYLWVLKAGGDYTVDADWDGHIISRNSLTCDSTVTKDSRYPVVVPLYFDLGGATHVEFRVRNVAVGANVLIVPVYIGAPEPGQ